MISKEVKRARVTAIVFGTLSSLTLIAFVFAFIQSGVARENEKAANQQVQRANQCEQQAKEMQLQAEQQRQERQESRKIQEALEQELNRLKNSRLK